MLGRFMSSNSDVQPVTSFLESHASTIPGAQIMQASCDSIFSVPSYPSLTWPTAAPGGVARLASTIITMLPSSPQVQDVYLDPDLGILSSLSDLSPSEATDTLCVDCTTLDQVVARQVAEQVGSVGAKMIDAPVSGGGARPSCRRTWKR